MTHEERAAYVRGVMSTCNRLNVPEHVVVDVCREFGIAPEELIELRNSELGHAKSSGTARK